LIRSRNQNSILAVATLGVYLGLILAGATPSVLAQAATTKQFNVKDEAEYTENLDRKPAETGSPSDDRLNAKITASVQRLVSKMRGPAGTLTAVVVLNELVRVVDRNENTPRILYDGRRYAPSVACLIGSQNLARAGIA
jgi:hypothetical protein